MDTSQDCHRSPETVPQVFGERPIDQPLSCTEKKIVIRKQDAFFLTENEAIDRNSTCWRNDDVRVSRASKPASGNP
ncbi:hypothetical protein CAJAP_07236 [Camponotus japonicus]